MAKFKVGDIVKYKGEAGREIINVPWEITAVTAITYYRKKGSVDIDAAESVGGPYELELASSSEPKKEIKEKDNNLMYQFKTGSADAIDFYEIVRDLSRENPIAKVEFRSKNGNRYFVIAHNSLNVKAMNLGISSPNGSTWIDYHELNHPSEYALWADWASRVQNAEWNDSEGTVYVSAMKVR